MILNEKAVSKISKKKYQSAKNILLQALSYPEISAVIHSSLLCNLSMTYNYLQNYKKSLECLKKALTFRRTIPITSYIGILMNISATFSYCGKHITSIKYCVKILDLTDYEKFSTLKALAYYNIAIEYYYIQKIDKSIDFFRTGLSFTNTFCKDSVISKLLLIACTKLLTVEPAKEICGERDSSETRLRAHGRHNTYEESEEKAQVQQSAYETPRHSFKHFPNIKSFRTNNSLSHTENSPLHTNNTLESSLGSPSFNLGPESLSILLGQDFNYQNKIEFLKKVTYGYQKLVSDFMDSCSEISKFCFMDVESYFKKNIKKVIFIQKWFKNRCSSSKTLQQCFFQFKDANKESLANDATICKVNKFRPKIKSSMLRSILKKKPNN